MLHLISGIILKFHCSNCKDLGLDLSISMWYFYLLQEECQRVSTEGQNIRSDLSTKFKDAIKVCLCFKTKLYLVCIYWFIVLYIFFVFKYVWKIEKKKSNGALKVLGEEGSGYVLLRSFWLLPSHNIISVCLLGMSSGSNRSEYLGWRVTCLKFSFKRIVFIGQWLSSFSTSQAMPAEVQVLWWLFMGWGGGGWQVWNFHWRWYFS